MTRNLDLDVDAPDKVAKILRDAAEAYKESASELASAWQEWCGACLSLRSHTRTREASACRSVRRPPHTRSMAGSPLKRARKQGVRLADGSIITFPYMPRVANLPPGWRHFSAAQKIEHLIGLDRCYEILSWGPITDLDPLRRSFQWQVMRVFLSICIKAVLDGSLDREVARERDRAAVLEVLARDLGAGEEKAQDSVQG